MKNILFLLSFICFFKGLSAQSKITVTIRGKLVDSSTRLPLPDATVTLARAGDSSALAYTVPDKHGAFVLKNLPAGDFILGISYIGYASIKKNITLNPAHPVMDMDTIVLATDGGMLQAVVVTRPPVAIKKDTVEFRADAFKTKPNATVEDLVKKMPGVEVDKEGNVTAQGENITKIYVDGKEFFSKDPKLAMKNLTADLVESIQVFDDMSDQAKFTRIDDGSRQRTINIKLKKDKKKGYFGRATLGAGSSDRYIGNVAANAFSDKTQLSAIGGANNVNRLGFTPTDIISNMGGMGGVGGGRPAARRGVVNGAPDGNTASWNAGVNYRDNWGSRLLFSGNYFATQTTTTNRTSSFSQNFFPLDSVAYTAANANSSNSNLNHRFNDKIEFIIDTMNSILATPGFSVQHSASQSFDSMVTRAVSPAYNYKAIGATILRSNARDGWNLGNNLLYRHRFNKPGRTFTIGWNTGLSRSNGDGTNASPYTFYRSDSTVSRVNNLQQQNLQRTTGFDNTISTSYTEMLGTNNILEFNYAYTDNKSSSDLQTFDYDAQTGKYDSVNKPLTNYFENAFTASRAGVNFRVKNLKYDFQLGGAVQFATLENMSRRAILGKDSTMQQRYTNFFPNASFNYNMGVRKSLRFNYRGGTRAPSIWQLQDVPNLSNPLNIRTGNPHLRQEFNNNFNFSYNTFNISNFVYLNTNLATGFVSNKIVNSIDTMGHAVQLTRPVNLDGAFNIAFSGTIGLPLKKVATGKRSPMNLNLTTTLRYNRDVSLLYQKVNFANSRVAGQRVNFNYNIPDKLDVGANASITYNDASYTVRQDLNNRYFSQRYSTDITGTFFKRLSVGSDIDYFLNTGRSDGFNLSVPLWNASAAILLFKKSNGELRFSVYDILNQNKSISRNIGDNYIEDSYVQVLQRFYMISFMYSLNHFGGRRNADYGGESQFERR